MNADTIVQWVSYKRQVQLGRFEKIKDDAVEIECEFKKWDWNQADNDSDLERDELPLGRFKTKKVTRSFSGYTAVLLGSSMQQLDLVILTYQGTEMADLCVTFIPDDDEAIRNQYSLNNYVIRFKLPNSAEYSRYVRLDVNSSLRKGNKGSITVDYPNFCPVNQLQSICQVQRDNLEDKEEYFNLDIEIYFQFTQSTNCPDLVRPKNLPLFELCERDFDRAKLFTKWDVKIILVDKEHCTVGTIPFYRYVLAHVSPIFASMIGPHLNDSECVEIKLELNSLNKTSFEAFFDTILLLYSGRLNLDSIAVTNNTHLALDLLTLCDRFMIKGIQDYCFESIVGTSDSQFSLKLALEAFHAGILYKSNCLCVRATQWIKRNNGQMDTEVGRKLMTKFMENHPASAVSLVSTILGN